MSVPLLRAAKSAALPASSSPDPVDVVEDWAGGGGGGGGPAAGAGGGGGALDVDAEAVAIVPWTQNKRE